MTDILVRNVDPEVRRRLKARAAEKGTSLSVEINAILREAAIPGLASTPSQGMGSFLHGLAAADPLTDEEWTEFQTQLEAARTEGIGRPDPFADERS